MNERETETDRKRMGGKERERGRKREGEGERESVSKREIESFPVPAAMTGIKEGRESILSNLSC